MLLLRLFLSASVSRRKALGVEIGHAHARRFQRPYLHPKRLLPPPRLAHPCSHDSCIKRQWHIGRRFRAAWITLPAQLAWVEERKDRQTKVRRREESKIERERSLRDLMAVYILAHVRGTVLTLLLNHSSMVLNRWVGPRGKWLNHVYSLSPHGYLTSIVSSSPLPVQAPSTPSPRLPPALFPVQSQSCAVRAEKGTKAWCRVARAACLWKLVHAAQVTPSPLCI